MTFAQFLKQYRELEGKATKPWNMSVIVNAGGTEPIKTTLVYENPCPLAMPYSASDVEFISASRNIFPALLSALEVAFSTLEDFQLGHTHKETDKHYRPLGDSYGYCDYCNTKVGLNEDVAKDACTKISALLNLEKK